MSQIVALDIAKRKLVVKGPNELGSNGWELVLEEEDYVPVTIVLAYAHDTPDDIATRARLPLYRHMSNSSWLDENWARLQKSIIEAMQKSGN